MIYFYLDCVNLLKLNYQRAKTRLAAKSFQLNLTGKIISIFLFYLIFNNNFLCPIQAQDASNTPIYSKDWNKYLEHNLNGQTLFGEVALVEKGARLTLESTNFSAISPQFTPPKVSDNFAYEIQFSLENFQVGDHFEFRYYFYKKPTDDENSGARYFSISCQIAESWTGERNLTCQHLHAGASSLVIYNNKLSANLGAGDQLLTLRLVKNNTTFHTYIWVNGQDNLIADISLNTSINNLAPNIYPPALVLDQSQAQAAITLRQFLYAAPEFTRTIDIWPVRQNDPNWDNLHLGHTEMVGQPQTIGEIGCALTSAVMLFNEHGYSFLPDGSWLDPDGLNFWLQNQPDGYINNNLLNWLALTRLSTQLHQKYHTQNNELFPKFEYKKVQYPYAIYNQNYLPYHLSDHLSNAEPVIVELPGHFVVAYQSNFLNAFNFIDPYYTNRQQLQDYPATRQKILSLRRLIPSFTDQSYLMINIIGSASVYVQDEQGVTLELESSTLYQPTLDENNPEQFLGKQYLFAKPNAGKYKFIIRDTTAGTVASKFNILAYNQDAAVIMFAQNEIDIDEDGEIIELTFSKASSDTFAVFVDTNHRRDAWEFWSPTYDWQNQYSKLQFNLLMQQKKFVTAELYRHDYLQRGLISETLSNQLFNFWQNNL
ncbi:MAG: hypothetical protein Q4G02_02170 [bacterium]|nr:hypothetical protein [bacterium]